MTLARQLLCSGYAITMITDDGPEPSVAIELSNAGAIIVDDLWNRRDLPERRARKLAKYVNQECPYGYIVSTTPAVGWLALPWINPDIPTMSIAHNDVDAYYAPLQHYGRFIDCAVGVSKAIAESISTNCQAVSQRFRCIHYGVNSFSEQLVNNKILSRDVTQPLVIGFVGRLDQMQKRIMDVVPVVQELAHRGLECTFRFLGDGPDRGRLERALDAIKHNHRVEFLGWLPRKRLVEEVEKLDCITLFSAFEGLPIAMLEAMGRGVVPVLSNIRSGNSQLIDQGQNGFLAEVGDFSAYADALEVIHRDPMRMKEMQFRAWTTARDYSVEMMGEEYSRCFNDLNAPEFSRSHRPNAGHYDLMSSCRSRYPIWIRQIRQYLNPRTT